MSAHTRDIETFLSLTKKKEGVRKSKGFIEHVPKEEVLAWRDEDGLDVMHHVILANNTEILEYLLHHGFFVRPHLPEVNPYGQLAALLGERTLLQVLLQFRPDDYYPVQIPLKLSDSLVEEIGNRKTFTPDTIIQLKMLHSHNASTASNASTSSTSSSSSNSSSPKSQGMYQIESLKTFLENMRLYNKNGTTTPLEVAARTGQAECVSVILNQCVLKRHADSEDTSGDISDFTLACIANSPQSLALLMHRQAPNKTEFEKCVQVCLHHAYPECLDLLLQLGRATKHLFKGMNFYHVLYTYSSDHGSNSYPRLTKTTEVLVKHGHDVSCKVPCRTYPIYSLLTHAFCFHDYDNTQYYIKALRCLLKHGADPNFDEVKYEKRHPQMAAKKIAGRQAFSSALHCLMNTVEIYAQYLKSPALAVNFVEDCCGVLMSNASDMNQVGLLGNPDKTKLQGSVLHHLCKSSVTLGVNPAMIRCVLRHGANPNIKVDNKYAINVYFDKLFEKMKSLKVIDVKKGHMEDAMTMCRLCAFMTSDSVKECLQIFLRDHSHEYSPQVKPYISAMKDELTKRSRQVKSLRAISGWACWTACQFQFERVHSLKVSSEIKTYILPMSF